MPASGVRSGRARACHACDLGRWCDGAQLTGASFVRIVGQGFKSPAIAAFGVAGSVAMRAVVKHGTALVENPARLAAVAALGWTRPRSWPPTGRTRPCS